MQFSAQNVSICQAERDTSFWLGGGHVSILLAVDTQIVLTSCLTWLSSATHSLSAFCRKISRSENRGEPAPGECRLLLPISPRRSGCLFVLAPLPSYPSLLTQSVWSPRAVALPGRAKLLAAGGATCAYQISAKAVAFPECPAMENWKVSHSEGGRGLRRREGFSLGSHVKTELWSRISDGPKSPLSASSWHYWA